jgi:hypothetical protein
LYFETLPATLDGERAAIAADMLLMWSEEGLELGSYYTMKAASARRSDGDDSAVTAVST